MKRGGSKMGYAEQFNLLSPCYKEGEQPAGFHMGGVKANATKKGKPIKKATKAKSSTTKKATKAKSSMTKKAKLSKQKGGSSCGASLSVAEMGVVDRPASVEPTASELAWDNRMKGGDPAVVVNGKPPNKSNMNMGVNVKLPNVNFSTVNSSTVNSSTVNSKNSPLNKIKNELFPQGTTNSGLAMKLIQTTKNSINPTNSTYSFEILYRLGGNNEIQNLSKTDVKFGEFLTNYRTISEEVFPRPQKPNGTAPKNGNGTAPKNGNGTKNGTTAAAATKNGNLTRNGNTAANMFPLNL